MPEPGYDDPKLLFIPIKLTLSLPVVEAEFISVMVARDYLFPILEGGLDLIERWVFMLVIMLMVFFGDVVLVVADGGRECELGRAMFFKVVLVIIIEFKHES